MPSMMWSFNKPARVALIQDNGESITYNELQQISRRITKKVPERCLVFSLCTNSIGSVAAYVGFLNKRIVPLLLNSKLEVSLLKSLINLYKPSYLWVPEKQKDSFIGSEVYAEFGYTLLRTNFEERYPLHTDLALLLTTSGSTGSPKLVRQSYRNIASNMEAIAQYLVLDDMERPITTLPMNYTYGLSIINSHLYVGATILLTDRTVIKSFFWDFFKEYEATSFGGVPFTYEMLDQMHFYKLRLPSLRVMTQAGGKLSVGLHEKFAFWAQRNGVHFVVMYGATEATARMSYLPYEQSVEKTGSIGVAIPGGKLYLVGDDGKMIIKPDSVGELVYEGDNVTLGYAECGKDLIKGDELNARLETGDMAKFDEDGYYYIVGRKKRFLKIMGNRVNLDEVERLIKNSFESLDCACSGIDDNMFVFISDKVLQPEVSRLLSEKTGLNRAAFNIVALGSIPKNDSGKTLYSQLQQYYRP